MEQILLSDLAQNAALGTPAYVYSAGLMRRRYGELRSALQQSLGLNDPQMAERVTLCYAVKALSNQAVLRLFQDLGAGADLVTRGELERVLKLKFDPAKIVYSGLGKQADDMDRAITAGVQLNLESLSELDLAQARAKALGRRARAVFRLNPQLDQMRAHQGHITTGKPDSKFGIAWHWVTDLLPQLATRYPDVDVRGLSVHIGSNMSLTDTGDYADFRDTFEMLRDDALPALRAAGITGPITLDLGGGIGVDYEAEPVDETDAQRLPNPSMGPYAALVGEIFGALVRSGEIMLQFEPGRMLTAEAGVLLTRVLHVKPSAFPAGEPFGSHFIVVDAGMNDLMRPGLYGAYHPIVPLTYATPDLDNADICGAVCETTDSFMRPTREWLGRHSNVFDAANGHALAQADPPGAHRKLMGGTFGEVEPKYADHEGGSRRTYEYFVKRRFPSSVQAGDGLAILHSGAYGAVMASDYNTRAPVAEILVDDDKYALIRPRPHLDDLIDRDQIPGFLY